MRGTEAGLPEPDDVKNQVDAMKRELDALQVHVMGERAPWYRQVPVLVSLAVSVGALLFSFWTNFKAEDRLEREERHEARVELRELIQRLQALPKENFELYKTYADDPNAQRTLGSFINTENLVLGQQAVALIDELEGDISAAEYYAAAYALIFSDQTEEAERLLEEGLKVADDALNEASILRQQAVVRFSVGDVQGGRELWRRALEVFEQYPERNDTFVRSTHAFTETSWALAELGAGQCREAWQHVRAAEEYTSQLGSTHTFTAQRSNAEEAIKKQCGSEAGY